MDARHARTKARSRKRRVKVRGAQIHASKRCWMSALSPLVVPAQLFNRAKQVARASKSFVSVVCVPKPGGKGRSTESRR